MNGARYINKIDTESALKISLHALLVEMDTTTNERSSKKKLPKDVLGKRQMQRVPGRGGAVRGLAGC